ncbi:MAG: hypothetical protein ISR59_10950 [Anaerolineales bacterium]|uniref:DUF5671 domain-containing protein n=1 Tax=Candidatus Desulfolinea nitratireducens TaxID=2841698 RepID=A0A8J6NNV4_9CHLR|nr:hypothetical protein [Candidatus Desulfolinea nitratireducens]MBL6961617.1 hypothetical protein [Anaerolineales bacterium]
MKTIRRLYFYAVAFISMEVVLWGLIGLARSIFSDSVGGGVDQLAQALALILVGVPVFGIHWWAAQRSAKKDAGEHESGVRAFFLYAALLALLVPLVQNGLAFLNRLILTAFDLSVSRAVFGGSQNLSDNLIAALMNALLATYFISVLRADWQSVKDSISLQITRRIYRYIWVFYSLIMSIAGVQQILRYLLSPSATSSTYYTDDVWFANGLVLTLVGVPLWLWTWKVVQDSTSDEAERTSLLRLGVLYLLSLSGVIFVLSVTGIVVNNFLQMILGEISSFQELMREINEPLSIGIPLGAVWAYYGYWLQRDLEALPDAPRRAGMNRLYTYILALIGLGATFTGITLLLSFVIDTTIGTGVWVGNLRPQLASSLATLIVGLPLWLLTWRPMQAEAFASDDAGNHARRSLVRKTYLYLILFIGVVGGMIAAVQLASLLFEALLGATPSGFTTDLLNTLQMLILFGGLLAYHWQSLRRDGMHASENLEKKHADFTVMLIDDGSGTLANQLAAAMEKESRQLKLLIHPADKSIPAKTGKSVQAVILPENLALEPTEKLRAWLRQFNGSKLIIPSESSEASDWLWMKSASDAAKAVRQLAEGERLKLASKSPGWMIVVYILAGMMGLEILFFLLVIVFDGF